MDDLDDKLVDRTAAFFDEHSSVGASKNPGAVHSGGCLMTSATHVTSATHGQLWSSALKWLFTISVAAILPLRTAAGREPPSLTDYTAIPTLSRSLMNTR